MRVETTADRLRLARDNFPEFAELLSENIIDTLARQLDDGKLEAVIEGAGHQNAPRMFRDVLQLVVRASEDDRRRNSARPSRSNGAAHRGSARRAGPPVTSRTDQPGSPSGDRDARPAAPVTSREEPAGAPTPARAETPDRPAAEDRQISVVDSLAQLRNATEVPPRHAEPELRQLDVTLFTGRIDAFDSTGGEVRASEDGNEILLTWSTLPSPRVVVYLAVASATRAPDSLHGAHRLGATTGNSLRVPLDAGPHFAVFAYEGETAEGAALQQGRPHGQAALLPEVRNLSADSFSSKVIIRWIRPDGVDRIRLCRSLPNRPLPSRYDPALELPVEGDLFEDETAKPGARYTYRIQTIQAKWNTPSAGVELTVDVPLTPQVVTDLRSEVRMHDGDPWVSLTYSQPLAGEVTIMQSETLPAELPSNRLFAEASLPSLGLGVPVTKPAQIISETQRLISNVPFKVADNTSRFYTPVTIGGGQLVVGKSVAVHYVAPVRDAEIIDRVDYQILRFAWPIGADAVTYEVAPPSAQTEDPNPQNFCDREQYDELGGVRLRLPDAGARIFVHGYRRFAGIAHRGESGLVDYRGRRVLHYRFAPVSGGRRFVLEVWSESILRGGLFAEIQNHPTRWPTVGSDKAPPPEGTTPLMPDPVDRDIPAGQWVPISEELTMPPGYTRAFLAPRESDDRTLMVIDPHPEMIRDSRGLAGSAEALIRGFGVLRGAMTQGNRTAPDPETVPVPMIRCVHCLQSFPATKRWMRCPPTGTCALVPDVERGEYQNQVTDDKPVYEIDSTGGRTLRCPGCGTAGGQQVCPLCHGDLPLQWASQDWFALTFVGAKTTGKTVTLTVLQHELRLRVVRSLSRTMQPADDLTAKRVAEFERRLYAEHEVAEGTQQAAFNQDVLEPMVFDLGLGVTDRPAAMALFDVSGEDMGSVTTTQRYSHLLTRSDGLVFLFDPLQIKQVQDKLRGEAAGYTEFPEMSADPATVLRNIAAVIRTELDQPTGKLPVRLCVVVAKVDGLQLASRKNTWGLRDYIAPGSVLMRDPYALDNPPLFIPGDAELQHREVRALLERLNALDFLNVLISNFDDYRFFAQSALGHGPISGRTLSDAGINSYRLADVVRMFMAERNW